MAIIVNLVIPFAKNKKKRASSMAVQVEARTPDRYNQGTGLAARVRRENQLRNQPFNGSGARQRSPAAEPGRSPVSTASGFTPTVNGHQLIPVGQNLGSFRS